MSSSLGPSATTSAPSEPANDLPKLSPEGREEAKRIINDFERDLKGIAGHLALDAGAKKISEPHVRQAHATLRKHGLTIRKPPKFYERADFLVGAGTLLIGLAPTASSIAKDFIEADGKKMSDHPLEFWVWVIAVPFFIFGAGTFMAGCGWVKSPEYDRG